MNNPQWLLFGLTGVLTEDLAWGRLRAFMPRPADDWEIRRLWQFSPAVREFESGRLSPVLFACYLIEEMGLLVHPDFFLREFPNLVSGYHPEAEELLAALSARHSLGVLANISGPHWERLNALGPGSLLLRRRFLSFKTGFRMPEPEAYFDVISALGCPPGRILFFDSDPNNVRGALDAGMDAAHVEGFAALRAAAGRLGLC